MRDVQGQHYGALQSSQIKRLVDQHEEINNPKRGQELAEYNNNNPWDFIKMNNTLDYYC